MQLCICGKKGDGKSLYAMHLLVQVLRETNLVVMTNLAIYLDVLNEYVQKKYPLENLDVPNRVIVMTDEQTLHFWRHRPPPREPYMFTPEQYAEIKASDPVQFVRPSVAYFLDEAHEFWNARNWQAFAAEGQKYLSQARKLGDQIYAITQIPSNLDAQFRKQTHYYIRVRNDRLRHIKVWLFRFRGQNRFVVRCYQRDPMEGTRETPFDDSTFTLDAKGLAGCYNTAAGVGIIGSKADIGRRAKGVPLMLIWPMILGTLGCIALAPLFLGKAIQNWLTGKKSSASATVAQASSAVVPQLPETALVGQGAGKPQSYPQTPVSGHSELSPELPKVHGYKSVAIVGNRVLVQLDDGTSLTESDISKIYNDSVVLNNGTVVRAAPVKWPEVKPVPASPAIGNVTGDVPQIVHGYYPISDTESARADSPGAAPVGLSSGRSAQPVGNKAGNVYTHGP